MEKREKELVKEINDDIVFYLKEIKYNFYQVQKEDLIEIINKLKVLFEMK